MFAVESFIDADMGVKCCRGDKRVMMPSGCDDAVTRHTRIG